MISTWVALLLGLGSCLDTTDPEAISPSTTQCQAQQAQLGVYDGFLRIFCGCQEAAGTLYSPGASLTCTVQQGTTLFFHTIGNNLNHQILSSDGTGRIAGPLTGPIAGDHSVNSFAALFNSVGTFPFYDGFNHALSGQIVVTP